MSSAISDTWKTIKDDWSPDLNKKPGEGPSLGRGPNDKSIEARAGQFETREQRISGQARAAGTTRSENDADLLGYSVPRRKGQARTILG